MSVAPIITLIDAERQRRFAWRPVWLDAGRLGGRWLWLRHFFAQPHSDGLWRWAYSVEERPAIYVDGRPIEFDGDAL